MGDIICYITCVSITCYVTCLAQSCILTTKREGKRSEIDSFRPGKKTFEDFIYIDVLFINIIYYHYPGVGLGLCVCGMECKPPDFKDILKMRRLGGPLNGLTAPMGKRCPVVLLLAVLKGKCDTRLGWMREERREMAGATRRLNTNLPPCTPSCLPSFPPSSSISVSPSVSLYVSLYVSLSSLSLFPFPYLSSPGLLSTPPTPNTHTHPQHTHTDTHPTLKWPVQRALRSPLLSI